MGENILKFFEVENRQLTNSKNSLQMAISICLDGNSDEEYILGDCQEPPKVSLPVSLTVPVPPKRPLPKTKKLRVRVKRLSRDILKRYEKKMMPISRDSSSVLPSQHPVKHIIRKSQTPQIVANKHPVKTKNLTNIIEKNALEIGTRKITGNIVGKPAAVKRPIQTALNTSNEQMKSSPVQVKNIKMLTKDDTANKKIMPKNNITSGKDEHGNKPIKIEPITMQLKNKIIYTKQMYNNDRKRTLQQTSPGNNITSLQDMERTVRKSQEAFRLKQQINGPKNNNQLIVKKQAITTNGGDNKNRDVINAKIRKGEQIKNRIRQELQKKHEITREEFRKKFVELLAQKKHEIGIGSAPLPGKADRSDYKAYATKLQLNKSAESKGTPKLVKEPTIVRVPVSKLIKIPQSVNISNTANRPEKLKGSINIVKNPEIIKLPHSIKIPDSKLFKGSEMKSVPAMAKGQDIVIASKVIINPELVKVPTAKVAELRNVSNSSSLSNKINFINVVKKEPSSTESLMPKAAIKLTPSHQSKFVQTDKDAANCSTKSIQTNFTFNDNICAVVDTVEFKLNCYHCCEVFSLRYWPSFIRHVKNAHHLDKYEQDTADRLLTPRNVIPHGTMSREIQVNTVNDLQVLGSKRNRSIDEVQDSDLMDTLAADNTESADDENQMDDDIERVLIALDMDEDDDESSSDADAPLPSPPKKIAKFSEIKQENREKIHPPVEIKAVKLPQISIKKIGDLTAKLQDNFKTETRTKANVVPTQTVDKATYGIKFNNQPLNKNKIITLPTNMKIIKQFKVGGPAEQQTTTTFAKPASSNTYTKVNISNIKTTPTSSIKEALNDSKEYEQTSTSHPKKVTTKSNISEDSINTTIVDGTIAKPTKVEVTSESPTKCDEFEFIDTLVTPETSIKNEALDISQNDVEQNVKIEPVFDVTLNNSGDETVLPKKMYEQREKPKKNVDLKKKLSSSLQKPKPIPSNLLDSDDEMPSNDENEDEIPSPTNGCGILFGLTNREIVLEFISELQKYPELWKFNRNNDTAVNYQESVQHLCAHINEKFNIEMTEFEIRLSVQRIKYWYCRTLQKMDSHKKDQQVAKKPQQPFQHTFPEYFKMLDTFLSSDSSNTKDLVLGKRFQKDDVNEINRYPKWMLYKEPAGGGGDATTDDKCSLANDLAFSEGAESDQGDEEFAASCKPFKSELDTSSAPPDPFICDICFVDFNRPMELTRHRARHFPPQYPCATCKKMHYSAYLADKCSDHAQQDQQKDMQGDNPSSSSPPLYVCEICGVSYKSVGTLNYHRKDKHFQMRNKCVVCKFTSISNYRLLEHQKKRHVVEYGTCEEVAKRTRARTDSKVPFNAEARREFEWRREMRKAVKPGELFYGCYRCKLVFETRKEKIQHNREEHPITESTVICLLCKKEKALFSNTNSVRKHYTVVHKVPWHDIDDLVKNTKQLYNLLSPLEIDQLNSSENPNAFVTKIMAKKLLAEQKEKELGNEISRAIKTTSEDFEKELNHTYDPFKFESNGDKRLKFKNMILPQDDESNDDDYNQSTLYNDIGIDHDYEDMQEDSYDEDDDDEYVYLPDPAMLQRYEFQCADGTDHYIIEEADCVGAGDEFGDIDVGQPGDQQLIYDSSVVDIENGIISEDIIEEIVEYDFMDDVMEERY